VHCYRDREREYRKYRQWQLHGRWLLELYPVIVFVVSSDKMKVLISICGTIVVEHKAMSFELISCLVCGTATVVRQTRDMQVWYTQTVQQRHHVKQDRDWQHFGAIVCMCFSFLLSLMFASVSLLCLLTMSAWPAQWANY